MQPLEFLLVSITTDQFAIIPQSFTDGVQGRITTTFLFVGDNDSRIIGVRAHFSFDQDSGPFLIIQGGCHFQVAPDSWTQILQNNGSLLLPRDAAVHFAMITVGTIRGILHAKTEGTPFNRILIPPINVLENILGDVTIESATSSSARV